MRSSGSAGRTAPPAGRESCSARASSRTPGRRATSTSPGRGRSSPSRSKAFVHEGAGELEDLLHLEGERYAAIYNIDGCSWAYEMRSTSRAVGCGSSASSSARASSRAASSTACTSRRRAARSRCTAPPPTRPSSGCPGRTRARCPHERPASARSALRPSSSPLARTRPSSRTTASASRRGSTPSPELRTRGRALSCTTSTEAPRAIERAELRLVLDASRPVAHPGGLRGVRAQRARLFRKGSEATKRVDR